MPGPGLVDLSGDQPTPRVLGLHAAALVAVLDANRQPAGTAISVDLGKVLEELLGLEKHYWLGRAEELGILAGLDTPYR